MAPASAAGPDGFITGIPLGVAQAYLLRDRLANAWAWAAAMPLLWALGWTVTTAGGIAVDRQFAVFGAYGAITVMVVGGAAGPAPRRHQPTHINPGPGPGRSKVMAQ